MADTHHKLITEAKFLIALLENSVAKVKEFKVINCIENGADVNMRFLNNNNNTPLHIAVIKGDRELVNTLLSYGARADITNDDGKTALELGKELSGYTGIVELLTACGDLAVKEAAEPVVDDTLTSAAVCTYKKRPGTANVRGQLYETKLLTLIYLRASRCRHVTQFYMGTNVDEIGDMDDVCLRFKTVTDDCMLFLQAKHKDNIVKGKVGLDDLWRTSGDFSLLKYFGSYRQIRDKFNSNCKDNVFRGRYEDIKCYFVMYTTVKDDIECSLKQPASYDVVTDLIGTGEQANLFRLKYNEQFIDLLIKTLLIEHMSNIGKKLFKLIQDKKHDVMLGDENIRSFHVVLAQKVIKVSELNTQGRRTGTFREEFFSSNDEILIALRETLYEEAAKNNKLHKDEIDISISKILKQPEAETISELIGCVLTYDSTTNTLKLNDEKRRTSNSLLSRLQVPQSVVNEAYAIAGRRKLCRLTFTLPAAFGNLDMTVTVNKKKAEKRLEFLANKISDVIQELADAEGNVVLREGVYAIDKRLEAGVLAINGGIAGAVGNLLVLDERNKLKMNLDLDTLGENAKNFLLKLEDRHTDLHKYRFIMESEDLPRLSLQATADEKRFVTDFLDNLYFYTCQAKENQLEDIVTKELQTYECSDSLNKVESRIRSNALFLKVHNVIQIWWMTEQVVPYLTRNTFDKIFRDFINKGLLSFLNYIYLNEMKNVGLEFEPEAVEVLSICRRDTCDAKMIVVYTDVHMLSCHKLVQFFRDIENNIFLDIDYLCRISPHSLKIITEELADSNISNVVLICEDISKYNDIIRACGTRKLILITNNNYVPTDECILIRDEKINFTDLSEASQRKLLETQFSYQGIEVKFADVFNDETKKLINSKVLEIIYNKDYITLGQTLTQSTYEDIKHYYVPRTLQRNIRSRHSHSSKLEVEGETSSSESEDKFSPTTLIDIHDMFEGRREKIHDVVLVLDAPGMGKSTLLTHLSLETKRRYPKIWIQRINLIDHTKQFHDWHENKIEVDCEEALIFVCKAVLLKESCRDNNNSSNSKNNIDLVTLNGEIKIANSEENALAAFTLNMFLNCFKEGQTVFLFDGFDEICPHYKKEVMQLLKYLARCSTVQDVSAEDCDLKGPAHRVWITSRPYNHLREALEKEFGDSYVLEPFYYEDIRVFLDKYMRRNLDLNVLTSNQLKNINGFFEYMKQCLLSARRDVNNLLKSVYIAAVEYFQNEIKRSHVTDDSLMYIKDWDIKVDDHTVWLNYWNQETILTGAVPLHVYIAIHYFQSQVRDPTIRETDDLIQQWDLDTNSFAFYERFIETKLKTIRFEEKNQMNIYRPDVKMTYEKEKKEFLDKHKKLAFYAVCDKEVLTDTELKDVKDIIKRMENGEEKTGLVDKIVNGEPRFVHYTFAEYLADEHIFDFLKSGEINKLTRMLDYILWRKVYISSPGTCHHLDLKIKSDPEFLHALNTSHVQNYIFETLVKQTRNIYSVKEYEEVDTFLNLVVLEGLSHFTKFVIEAIISVVNWSNFGKFIGILQNGKLVQELIGSEYDELVCIILDCIRKFDPSEIDTLFSFLLDDNNINSASSNEEFIAACRPMAKEKNSQKMKQYASSLNRGYNEMTTYELASDVMEFVELND